MMHSKDAEAVAKALLDLESFLSAAYMEPGLRDPNHTIEQILQILDDRDVMAAARRIIAGYGLHVVK
jgi:hypothetical protein